MPGKVKDAIESWRRAEKHAREVEALFESAFADYTQHQGPEPSPDLVRLVSQSRKRANALLSEVISLLKAEVK